MHHLYTHTYSQSPVKTMHHLYSQKSSTAKPRKDHAPFIHTEVHYSQSPVKTMHHLYTQKSPTVRVLYRPCTIYTHIHTAIVL